MMVKTIGMLSSYKNLGSRDWLWKQTPNHFGVWKNIQMLATAKQPDLLLLYQYDFPSPQQSVSWWEKFKDRRNNKTEKIPNILQKVPQEKIIFLLREPPLAEVIKRNQLNYQIASQYCGYISGPDEFAPIPEFMPAIWYLRSSFAELNTGKVPEKQNICSWITSGISRTENHRKRLSFLRLLQDNHLKFDLYGRNLPDWSNSLGTVEDKWNAIAPYYYNLAIENYAENDLYVSEKLWDSLLGWCLPIYYGGSAADKLLPKGSFLRLPSLDEKGLAYIQEVTSSPDAWYEAKEKIAEARQIILHELNLLQWLSDFVEKF
ncbi:MAG: glycosyltransferase family 10 domain-containing protein [Pleurocapsa sp.]